MRNQLMLITEQCHVKPTNADFEKVWSCVCFVETLPMPISWMCHNCQVNVFMYTGDNKIFVYLLSYLCLSYLILSVNSNRSYSPETPNLGQNRQCFEPCDLETLQMTLKNKRAPLLCYFKVFASFRSHWWIQTRVTVRKHPIWVKI